MNRNSLKFLLLTVLISTTLIASSCSDLNGGVLANEPESQTTTNAQEETEAQNIDYANDESWKLNTGNIIFESKISVSGKGVSIEGNAVKITKGGDFEVRGTIEDGMIYVNTQEKVKLRLSGTSITNSDGAAIYFENSQKSFITLSAGTQNYLCDGKVYTETPDAKGTLFTNDSLEIKGSGTLYITSNYKNAIVSDDDILIEEGVIIVEASKTDGLHANDDITITGGSITINCDKDAVESEGTLNISGGNITINAGDDGIHSQTDMIINGGEIYIQDSHEGIESKTKISVTDGTIRIRAADDAINTETELSVSGGYIYAVCDGDGFDSNGDILISGGTTIVFSGNNANGPVDVGENSNKFVITGGTLIAGGGRMTAEPDSASTQHCIWINSNFSADALVNIASENGEELLTFASPKSENLILVSSDKIKADTVYNISTGGSSAGTLSDSLYSGGEYKDGTLLGSVTTSEISVTYGQSTGNFGNLNERRR